MKYMRIKGLVRQIERLTSKNPLWYPVAFSGIYSLQKHYYSI